MSANRGWNTGSVPTQRMEVRNSKCSIHIFVAFVLYQALTQWPQSTHVPLDILGSPHLSIAILNS